MSFIKPWQAIFFVGTISFSAIFFVGEKDPSSVADALIAGSSGGGTVDLAALAQASDKKKPSTRQPSSGRNASFDEPQTFAEDDWDDDLIDEYAPEAEVEAKPEDLLEATHAANGFAEPDSGASWKPKTPLQRDFSRALKKKRG